VDAGISKVSCEFCSKNIEVGNYVVHVERCSKNPVNMHSPCQFCKEVLPNFILDKHKIFCSQNPENIKIICIYCKTSFKKKAYDDHIAECENKYKTFEHDKECPICLCELKKTQELKVLECFHQFHKDCILEWSKKRRLCPICRAFFRP